MSASVFWRAALIQAASVATLSVALAIAFPDSFFEDWGWLAGPAAWAICSLVTARALGLPVGMTLLGAALFTPLLAPPERPYVPATMVPAVLELREELMARPGGEWVNEMYRRHRGASAEVGAGVAVL